MNTSQEHRLRSSEVLARTGLESESGARVYPEVVSECSAVWCPSVGARIFERGVCPSVESRISS